MTLPFDHTHNLDLGVEISRSESEIAWSQEWDGRLTWNEKDVSHPFMTMILTRVTMVRWADLPDSDWGDFRRWHAVDISSYYCAAHHVSDTLWYMVSWYLYHNMLMYHQGCRGALKSIKRHYLHVGKNKALKRSYFSDFSGWGIKKVLFWKSNLLE